MTLCALDFRHCQLDWSRVYIAGVVNVTPDSFSDGGLFLDRGAAVAHGQALAGQGADILDIGGESTRPGAGQVDADIEIARVVPVIRELVESTRAVLSIDTTKAAVAEAALAAGAEIVNDISGGLFDPRIIEVTARAGATYICGHVRGAAIAEVHAGESSPPDAETVSSELAARVASLPVSLRHRTIVDPCLGFGKKGAENFELIQRSGALGRSLGGPGLPVMIGPSRKRFVAALCGRDDPARLDIGTVGACLAAAGAGANILRTHNVELLRPALMVYEAIVGHSP